MKFQDALSRVAWQDFEVLVANHYRAQGYDVLHCGDGHHGRRDASEVDLRMRKDGRMTLVLCRHESVSRVNAEDVARLVATGAEDGAEQVIVISSGDIPEAVRQAGEAGGAKVIDGVQVRAMLGEALMDLHPVRSLPGVDAQHGKAQLVTRGGLPRSRRRPRWSLALLVLVLLAALVYFVPPLRRMAGLTPLPAHAAAQPRASSTQELSLPTPPAH